MPSYVFLCLHFDVHLFPLVNVTSSKQFCCPAFKDFLFIAKHLLGFAVPLTLSFLFLLSLYIYIKSYERTVRNIATTSLRLAVMMPHILFVGMAAVTKLLMPKLVQWLACETALRSVLQLWYPLVATILLLHDIKMIQLSNSSHTEEADLLQTPQKGTTSTSSPQKKTPISRMFPRTTPASVTKRQQKRREVSEIKERESYWLHFWMTSAAFLCGKRFVAALPFIQRFVHEWGKPGLMQLELLFYIWVFAMPYLLPKIANAPEGRPLYLLEPKIRQMAQMVYQSTLVFSDTWWQTWVMTPLTTGLNLLVTLRMLSKHFADELRDVVIQSKALLLPSVSLFMPRFLSIFGLLFVQFAFPLHKQSTMKRKERHAVMLRYWVIHILLTVITEATESILWWIPLSRVLTFGAFVVIGTSQAVVDMCVRMILHDLEVFRLLPSTGDATSPEEDRKSSWAARGVHALLERLPKANMTPAKGVLETATEEESADVQENNCNAVYSEEEEEADDAVLYPSSEDDPDAISSSEGSDSAYRPAEERNRAQRSGKQPSKRSRAAKGKDASTDKENEQNVQTAQTRRSGRHRSRTERLAS